MCFQRPVRKHGNLIARVAICCAALFTLTPSNLQADTLAYGLAYVNSTTDDLASIDLTTGVSTEIATVGGYTGLGTTGGNL